MKQQKMKRLISATLALAFVIALALPASAASIKPNTRTYKFYMSSKKGNEEIDIELASGNKDFTINRADVKVIAGSAGARIVDLRKRKSAYSYEDIVMSGKGKTETEEEYSYTVSVKISKAGSAAVSYKIGKKTYRINIKAFAYKNPAKSILLTGVNDGKNFASRTYASRYASKKVILKEAQKDAVLYVRPASGWRITCLELEDLSTSIEREVNCNGKGLASARVKWGTIVPYHSYEISAEFKNVSNGETITCYYDVNN